MDRYFAWFHETVMTGLVMGLTHPIEWIINAHRCQIQNTDKYLLRFLHEMYEVHYLEKAQSIEQILDWVNNFYGTAHMCYGYFDSLKQSND